MLVQLFHTILNFEIVVVFVEYIFTVTFALPNTFFFILQFTMLNSQHVFLNVFLLLEQIKQ